MRIAAPGVLIAFAALAADDADRVMFPSQRVEGRNTVACENFDVLGRCITVMQRMDGGAWLAASAPLSIDAGVISCTGAADGVAGCITNGDQVLGAGTKILPGDVYMAGYVRAWVQGQAFIFDGRRSDPDEGAEVTIRGMNDRSTGQILDLRPYTQGSVFSVSNNGVVSVTGPSLPDGGPFAQIVDATGLPGHPFITTSPGQAVVIQGKFDDPAAPSGCATLLDGGRTPDGGCYSFAGRHGDVTSSSKWPRDAGMLFDWQNPTSGVGAYTDKKAFIDFSGGFGQAHGLTRAQFAQCPADFVLVRQNGQGEFQYRYGHEPSALLYAFDEERWYFCTEDGWAQVPIINEVLAVQNGAAAPKSLDSGGTTCNAGTRTVTFTTAFSVAPAVFCSDITDYTKPCGTTAKTTTTATLACNGTDALNWMAVGLR